MDQRFLGRLSEHMTQNIHSLEKGRAFCSVWHI